MLRLSNVNLLARHFNGTSILMVLLFYHAITFCIGIGWAILTFYFAQGLTAFAVRDGLRSKITTYKHFLFFFSRIIWILENVNIVTIGICITRLVQPARFYFASCLSMALYDATRSTCGADKETSTVDPVKRKAWIINERLQRAMGGGAAYSV